MGVCVGLGVCVFVFMCSVNMHATVPCVCLCNGFVLMCMYVSLCNIVNKRVYTKGV